MPTAKKPTADAAPARSRSTTRQIKYSRPTVEALVKMFEGAATILYPGFREAPIQEQEHGWLVDDWYEFGLGSPMFQKLVLSMFSNSVYVKLGASHLAIVGARVIQHEGAKVEAVNRERANQGFEPIASPLPLAQMAAIVSAAYIVRVAAEEQDQIIATLEAQEEASEEAPHVEPGRARDSRGQNGVGENQLSPLSSQAAGIRPDAGNQR